MKIVKRILFLLLAVCCITISVVPVSAAEIQPRFQTLNQASADLNIKSGGQAECLISARAKATSYRIEWTMTLYDVGGDIPIKITSWSAQAGNNVDATEYFQVTAGSSYRVEASFKVVDSKNVTRETYKTSSQTVTY